MAGFINFEVDVEDDSDHDEEVSDDSDLDSLKSFIDNDKVNNYVNFYHNFGNIETNIEQTLKEEYDKGLHDVENFAEISSLCESSEDELEIDDFKSAAEKIENFSQTLLPKTNNEEEIEHNKLIRAILYAVRFDKENRIDICDKNDFKKVIDQNCIDQSDEEGFQFILDLQKFNNDCY